MVNGAVYTLGSVTVTVQRMVSSETRRKRSTTSRALLVGMPFSRRPAALDAIQPRLWKFLDSTTRVSPSQRPRESPIHMRMFPSMCGWSEIGMMRTSWIISCWMTKWSGVCTMR